MDDLFKIGEEYTREDVQELLNVPEHRRGGAWDTGYTFYEGNFYIFCNVGSAGRTGHDYPNRWDGPDLIWSARTETHLDQSAMRSIADKEYRPHIFWRSSDRTPFAYAGRGYAVDVQDTSPVAVRWSFPAVIGIDPSTLSGADIASELEREGYQLSQGLKKLWKATRPGSTTFYIKRENESYGLVVDPQFTEALGSLVQIQGVRRPLRLFYHNSNMRDFPKRTRRGKQAISYGIDFGFESIATLQTFLKQLNGLQVPPSTGMADTMGVDPKTESEATRAIRLGQQSFRRDLLSFWDGKCALTGLNFPELLRASHIKPWRDSDAKERLDPDNGLLLAVHIDGLFDRGLISFDDDGLVILSERLTEKHLGCFGISAASRIWKLTSGHRKYLQCHRSMFGFSEGVVRPGQQIAKKPILNS